MASREIPKTMKAAQVVEFNQPLKITSLPPPPNLAPQDLLIRVTVASLCHTDLMVQRSLMETSLPITTSHEGAGTVVATGSAVQNLKPGDRVMGHII
ncbi:hypothetical protein GRF29_1536g367529 [Pseudopithomyces chartarum]|uniref:Alcohol dehydrogenase-like N-terminal domain-containing protein n=1 Tax=Pseudopithomyces chartarum TaxID=1892770 RepID=A0AAN6RBZ6_9PLEO|nr:hypothetical protein GRF29_1536g367529 [Pseudopithomyces chartarum]